MKLVNIIIILVIGIYIGSYINLLEHKCSRRLKTIINILIRQAARWSTALKFKSSHFCFTCQLWCWIFKCIKRNCYRRRNKTIFWY